MALQVCVEIFGFRLRAENKAQQFRQIMLGQAQSSQLPIVGAQSKAGRGSA